MSEPLIYTDLMDYADLIALIKIIRIKSAKSF